MGLSINPVARYAQNGTWVDDWGGYNGTPIGATFDTVNQKLGNAAGSYDGVDDYLQIDNLAAALATTTKGSWAGWVRPTTALKVERIISFADSTGTKFLDLRKQEDGTLRMQAYDGAQRFNLITDNPVFSDNTWAHVGAVQNGTSPLLYVDGVVPAQTLTAANPTFWFNDYSNLDQGSLGCLNDLTGPRLFWGGLLDEVLFFDDALTAADFIYLYNGGAGREIINGISSISFSIFDKQYNAFNELSGKNTII